MQLIATAAVLFGLSNVQAYKDNSYYKAGSGNPNVYEKMFWSDADNVLEDLDQFSSLYVEFQHCAWTLMDYGDGADEESVDENDYWYMNKVPPFGANVAFSLYGSLKGESFKGCNSNSFINSFYTRTGYESFVYSMSYAGAPYFSNNNLISYSSQCQGNYGVGCDYTNGFAYHSYSTEECDPENYSGTSNSLSSLNTAMNNAQCVQIFDSSNSNYYNGYNYTVYGTPLELLAYSRSCFYQNFWSPDGECPDPYNKIEKYQANFNNGVTKSRKSDPFELHSQLVQDTQKYNKTGGFLFFGAMLILGGALFAHFLRKPKRLNFPPKVVQESQYTEPEIQQVENKPQVAEEPIPATLPEAEPETAHPANPEVSPASPSPSSNEPVAPAQAPRGPSPETAPRKGGWKKMFRKK